MVLGAGGGAAGERASEGRRGLHAARADESRHDRQVPVRGAVLIQKHSIQLAASYMRRASVITGRFLLVCSLQRDGAVRLRAGGHPGQAAREARRDPALPGRDR